MQYITDAETQIFVTFKISPLPITYKQSLADYLLDEVWALDGCADEDIRVVTDYVKKQLHITAVRYQFGEDYGYDRKEEIEELIEKHIGIWMAKNMIDN